MLPPADNLPQRRCALFAAANNGVAFFAYVGGFVFGFAATKVLADSGRISPLGRNDPMGTGMTTVG